MRTLAALLLAAVPPSAVAQAGDVRVEYELRHEPPAGERDFAQWVVQVDVARLPRKGRLDLRLSDWGGWPAADWPHVELLESRPALQRGSQPGHWTAALGGEREARIRYRVRLTPMGSDAQRRFGLLPTWSEAYAFGYSWNTLASVEVDGARSARAPTLRIEARRGTPIVTGWAGRSEATQTATLDVALGNAPIVFGAPAVERVETRAGFPLEVRQFGGGPDITGTLAEVIAACAPAFGRAFGVPARRPYRAFVTDHQGGGMGSHHGLRIGATADAPADHAGSPWLRSHVAHELMHDWLGIGLTEEDPSLVWFKEGFTEYLALWQATSAGLVSRDWFAGRLLELEGIARERSSAGQVAFGDPTVTWRDGDGPNEMLAYTGAPLLALRIDAELRAAGEPGLPQLVRDLLAREPPRYSLEDLRRWLAEHGQEARWEASIQGAALPDVAESLELAGYATERVPADLTYFGLRTDGAEPGCTVLVVDPAGPAGEAGVRAGDVLTGWFPARGERAHANDPDPEFPFGLGTFEPGVEGTFLGIRRGGEDLKVPLEPRVLRGAGHVLRRGSAAKALEAFFRFDPR